MVIGKCPRDYILEIKNSNFGKSLKLNRAPNKEVHKIVIPDF
jgi:hypothetical protein